jgi:GTP-binding protein HflX
MEETTADKDTERPASREVHQTASRANAVHGQPGVTDRERALLVQVILAGRRRSEAADSLSELERLADTAGIDVVGHITQNRTRYTPNFCIGEGKLADIQLACRETGAGLIVTDNDLTPAQVNNLDLALGIRVIDRTELILQIFARRARSAEAKTQVELAQLQYLVSRIPVSRRQQRFQGGIGMRGPGESPLQMRNAPMRRRIKHLRKKLVSFEKHRVQTRSRRPWPAVALVGYTNAGKSTLLNAVASADAYVDDRLFATLDTKTRLVHLDRGRQILLSDTVGFIRHLPHGLVASFRSTLEEVCEAELLLHVADASHLYVADHCGVVDATLEEIGAQDVPRLVVLNKCDRPEAIEALDSLRSRFPDAVEVSAMRKTGLDGLRNRLRSRLSWVKSTE